MMQYNLVFKDQWFLTGKTAWEKTMQIKHNLVGKTNRLMNF